MYNLIFMNMHFNHGILCFNKFYNTVLISDGSLIIKSGFEWSNDLASCAPYVTAADGTPACCAISTSNVESPI